MPVSGEWSLLGKIEQLIKQRQQGDFPGLVKGIGDDCAVFHVGEGSFGLISTDISIASVHFRVDLSSPEDIGYRAMISNISDISAMGGTARYAFIAIGIPETLDDDYIVALYKGLLEGAAAGSTAIAGGDISKAGNLTISISIYGDLSGREPLYRHGANTGNTIYCTGTLGGSKAGLEVLLSKDADMLKKYNHLVERHNRPPCRHELVQSILRTYQPTAMIDISDGILSDLGHICRASEQGSDIDIEALPLHDGIREYALHEMSDLKELLLTSGEEYELLFTSTVKKEKEYIHNIPVSPLGRITEKKSTIREKGKPVTLSLKGFDHFRT